MNPEFSIVVPIAERNINLVSRTLPSWLRLGSDDIVLCLDKPVSNNILKTIREITVECEKEGAVRILELERDTEWLFHQAYVRRVGFRKARNNVILTGDIDLVVNKNVLKAVKLVGKNNIGLVSLAKFRYPLTPIDYWRTFVLSFLRKIVHSLTDPIMATTTFSGLYCIFRPYWRDSEPTEEVKRLVNAKQFFRGERPDIELASAVAGEDTFLRDCMLRKHRCVYLREIGAIDLGIPVEYRPYVQYMIGQHFAREARSFTVSLGRAILRGQPYYLQGYLQERSRIKA